MVNAYFLQNINFNRKNELQTAIDNIAVVFTLTGMGKMKLEHRATQRFDFQHFVKSILFEESSLDFYISESSKKIKYIIFKTKHKGNFNDLFKNTFLTQIRDALPEGGCEVRISARPLSDLDEQDILDFFNQVLNFNKESV